MNAANFSKNRSQPGRECAIAIKINFANATVTMSDSYTNPISAHPY